MTPEEAMQTALAIARRGLGRTCPNPSVGAAVFRPGGLLGRGRTQTPPGPHAEVVALAVARRGGTSVRGADVAVTLEPCCFSGRTGPCTEALIEAGVRRVYVGCRDPHPRVAGRGVKALRAAGIDVVTGVLEPSCLELHRGFFSVWKEKRPFITLKLATSLDGRIATASGESRWITGERSRQFVHTLRSRVDAVMVGSETARTDDPQLSARRNGVVTHRPVRVLVDSKLRVPTRATLYQEASLVRTIVLTRKGARGTRVRREMGAELLPVRVRGDHLDLRDGLTKLAAAGLTTVLVEGGGQLAAALVRTRLVDEIHWLQAPILLGEDGRPALGALELTRLADAVSLRDVRRRTLGKDSHLWARVESARSTKGRG